MVKICKKCGELKELTEFYKCNLTKDLLMGQCKKCHGKTNHNRDYWIEWFALALKQSNEQLKQLKVKQKISN